MEDHVETITPGQNGELSSSGVSLKDRDSNSAAVSLVPQSEHDGTGENSLHEDEAKLAFSRYRPRTFPYEKYLPYNTDGDHLENLQKCVENLYIAVKAGDFVPGATHWTREIRGWIQLKFDLPRQIRVRLVKLYYELALAPGLESGAAERFASMFMTLTK